jgi:hypothetical protein
MRPLSIVQAWGLATPRMRILWSILLILLLVPPWTGEERLPLFDRGGLLVSHPVAAPRRFGALTLVGVVQLDGALPGFGGFSAVAHRNGRLLLLSDGGNWLQFALRRGRVVDPRIGYLPAGPGDGWAKGDRDSESLALDPVTGTAWIGFETFNQIWRYDAGFTRAEARVAPPAMRRWQTNRGAEAMVRLRDGRFVVICERGAKRRLPREGLIFPGDPTDGRAPQRFGFVPPAGYDVSDATELPDGDLLVLTRQFALPFRFTAKLVRVARAQLRAGATIRGREVATLAGGTLAENWEGVTAVRDGGRTVLWLVSDSDAAVLQHSKIAKFVLSGSRDDTPNGPAVGDRRAAREKR